MSRPRFFLVLVVSASLLVPGADAQSRRRAVRHPSSGELIVAPLAGYDPSLPVNDDLDALRPLIGDATVVALGESFHTSAGFYQMKHRILRFLVEELGFRAFAIESLWQGAERANAYVQTCSGTAESAIGDHINVWQSVEYADLVRWMCEWNRTHAAPSDKLTLFGFDIQQPWYDGPELVKYLKSIGIAESDPRSQGLRSCESAFGLRHPFGEIPDEVHATCIRALDDIEQHFETNRTQVVQRTSEAALATAVLRVVGLRAWQESVKTIAHDFAEGYNARDEGMAYAFHELRATKANNAKTVVWAANSHVAQNPLPRGEVPFGSHLKARLGDDYVTFALTAYDTQIDFPGYPCGPATRQAGSVEELLAAYGHGALVAHHTGPAPYSILPMGIDLVRPYQDYDGIIFLQHSPKMRPLLWAPCQ